MGIYKRSIKRSKTLFLVGVLLIVCVVGCLPSKGEIMPTTGDIVTPPSGYIEYKINKKIGGE